MRHLIPILFVVASACVDTDTTPQPADHETDDTIAAAPDTALELDDAEPDDTATPPPPTSFCSLVCIAATAEAAADCSELGVGASAFCGIATDQLCQAVCNSRGPRTHCSHVHGGKGCMNTQYMWWCDTAVDGNKVRMQYELNSPFAPGIVRSVWAPSRACQTVRFPTAGITKRWRVCAENNGCSGWFFP